MSEVEIPQELYEDDRLCGEFIVRCKTLLSNIAKLTKYIEESEKKASNLLLDRLAATGQEHFAFVGIGTFARTKRTVVSFPSSEKGGKEAAIQWLLLAHEKGIVTMEQLLDVQQARVNKEPVEAIEAAVEAYNEQQKLVGSEDLLPPSPFNKFDMVRLSSPRSFKK